MNKINKEEVKYIVKKNKRFILLMGYIMTLFVAVIVYFSGGGANVYTNLAYIAIAMVSSSNSRKMAVLHAGISGLLVGPFMQFVLNDIDGSIMQEDNTWIIRLGIYVFSALLISHFTYKIIKEENLIDEQNREILLAQRSTLNSLVKITETRDTDTGGHIDRIVELSRLLLIKCKSEQSLKNDLKNTDLECIASASALHDIGKVAISDSILLKRGKLTSKEFNEMKTHTIKGAKALLKVKEEYPNNDYINAGYNITLYHHEWYDGSGYPEGLSSDNIPFSARVVAIVDVYDALRSDRPYKAKISHIEAIKIMEKERNTHFDPLLFDLFIKNQKEFEDIYGKLVHG